MPIGPRILIDLIRILDSEIRLITPTDPEGKEELHSPQAQTGAKYYQLTHDYPRAVAAGLADPQAKGDTPGPGRIAAGGSGGGVECSTGESATAVAVAMGQHSLADAEEELDAAATEDDAKATQYHGVRAAVVGVLLCLIGWRGLRNPRHC